MTYSIRKHLHWTLDRRQDGTVTIYLFGDTDYKFTAKGKLLREGPRGQWFHIKNEYKYGDDFT